MAMVKRSCPDRKTVTVVFNKGASDGDINKITKEMCFRTDVSVVKKHLTDVDDVITSDRERDDTFSDLFVIMN